MQDADQASIDAGIPQFELMQRAGVALADAAQKVAPDTGRMVIVTGGGNNGGDGYAAARVLSERNVRVTVVALIDPARLKGAAAEHAWLAGESGAKIRPATGVADQEVLACWLSRAVLVIDAVFGTGLSRPLKGWLREAVDIINASDRPVLSLDIPSGIHSDSGAVLGTAIQASWTLPVAAVKWGHWLADGRKFSGELLSPADIGIDLAAADTGRSKARGKAGGKVAQARRVHAELLDGSVLDCVLSRCRADAHKGDFGHLWIFGGSEGYTGAPRLAGMGAMAVHAGLVSLACPDDVYAVIASSSLELMVHRQGSEMWKSADALVAGPGWGRNQQGMLKALLGSDSPLLLDADALNILSEDAALLALAAKRKGVSVFTPHPGEAARLLGCPVSGVQENRPESALRLADALGGWVVLKGAQTLISSPDGRLWLCPFGNQRLARAGSGDVLSGMIGGLLGQGIGVEDAVCEAVVLHAKAGECRDWYRAGQLPDKVAEIRETALIRVCNLQA